MRCLSLSLALCVCVLWTFTSSGHASGAAVPAPGGAPEAVVGYLKTRGLVPLWLGNRRPLLGSELQRVLQAERAAGVLLTGRDRQLLDWLRVYLGSNSLSVTSPYGLMGLSGGAGWLEGPLGTMGISWWSLGGQWWPGRHRETGFVATRLDTVDILLGRAPVTWGPDPLAGLVFSSYAGALDRLEVASQPWNWLRFSKFFGRVDERVTVVGQRADLLLWPNFRLGIGDAVLMVGNAYWLYLLNPIPPLNALDVGFAIFDKTLHQRRNDNGALSLDFDWLAFPGLRFYGELLVDDVQFVWPTLISPELAPARWGATLGVHWLDTVGAWDLTFQYTVVPNWTYAAVAASTRWMARGCRWVTRWGTTLTCGTSGSLRQVGSKDGAYGSPTCGRGRDGQTGCGTTWTRPAPDCFSRAW